MTVSFHTNLDLHFPETWPEMDHVPQIGSRIESKSGLELKVVGVNYRWRRDGKAYAVVELHLASSMTIEQFNKWDRERARTNR